mmetsp:Transcript_102733/g.258845  ORF Transcript_102733/g.258845 Transcript_102733/m.258845 type:complete len:315 (-) Transcript_102733:154-1098(-)
MSTCSTRSQKPASSPMQPKRCHLWSSGPFRDIGSEFATGHFSTGTWSTDSAATGDVCERRIFARLFGLGPSSSMRSTDEARRSISGSSARLLLAPSSTPAGNVLSNLSPRSVEVTPLLRTHLRIAAKVSVCCQSSFLSDVSLPACSLAGGAKPAGAGASEVPAGPAASGSAAPTSLERDGEPWGMSVDWLLEAPELPPVFSDNPIPATSVAPHSGAFSLALRSGFCGGAAQGIQDNFGLPLSPGGAGPVSLPPAPSCRPAPEPAPTAAATAAEAAAAAAAASAAAAAAAAAVAATRWRAVGGEVVCLALRLGCV